MSLIKTLKEISNIRESGKYLNELLMKLYTATKPGIATIELEFIAENYVKSNNIKWAFKWYQWFPANLCLSVNDCVVHGIPDDYILQNWDVLKIDCWINYQWWITDSAISIVVWWELTNPLWHALIKATKEALDLGINQIWPGIPLINYSSTVYNHVKNKWFSVIEKLTGHGVWNKLHEDPHVYNYPHPTMKKTFFKPGMVIAFEPITAVTSRDFVERAWNDWNLYCKNSDIWVQREYTVLITEKWYEILSGITENLWF